MTIAKISPHCIWSFIKRQTVCTSSGNELQNEWWLVKTNNNEWYNERQRVTTSGTASDNEGDTSGNEWERMTTSGTTNENEWKLIRASNRELFWFQNETIYAMHNYNMFSNIGCLWIRKFPINFLTKETAWKQGDAMLRNFGKLSLRLEKMKVWWLYH